MGWVELQQCEVIASWIARARDVKYVELKQGDSGGGEGLLGWGGE